MQYYLLFFAGTATLVLLAGCAPFERDYSYAYTHGNGYDTSDPSGRLTGPGLSGTATATTAAAERAGTFGSPGTR